MEKMTRTTAREIAVQICFNVTFESVEADAAVDAFFDEEYYATLSGVDELYGGFPDETQLLYIRRLVKGVAQRGEELDSYIEKYAQFWKVGRISKIAASIMRVCIYEILYMEDIPDSAAINEAVEMAKGYEEQETVSFINGVLGGFYRGEIENGQS